jgi:hypothetical protein
MGAVVITREVVHDANESRARLTGFGEEGAKTLIGVGSLTLLSEISIGLRNRYASVKRW